VWRKKLKVKFDYGYPGSSKCKRGCGGAFGRNLASAAMRMFSHLIYFMRTFYEFCTLKSICKHSAIIIVDALRLKPVSFP
jgi:hypothetical protein